MDLHQKLAEERRRRLAAEQLLKMKEAELEALRDRFRTQSRSLGQEVSQLRRDAKRARGQASLLIGETSAAKSEMEETRQRLWGFLQCMQDGFAVFNSENQLLLANDSFYAPFSEITDIRTGISANRFLELVAENRMFDTDGQDASRWAEELASKLLRARPRPVVVRLMSGRSVRLIARSIPSGERVLLAIDVTENEKRQDELRTARQKADTANQAKSAFLANMSHEIRTPMNGIVGMAQLMRDTALSKEQVEYLDTITSSSEALLRIINDVLDYSKIEAGKISFAPRHFDLKECVDEVIALFRPSVLEKNLELTVKYDGPVGAKFLGDSGRVRQILINLIGNAVKFTPSGQVSVCVTVKSDRTMIQKIQIRDTGIGIPQDKLRDIFGTFSQVDDAQTRGYGGTGLGLPIARNLAKMMGGDIFVDSELGKGSEFTLLLRMPVSDAENPSLDAMGQGVRKPVILAADDNKTNRVILAKMLDFINPDIRFATDGEEAVALFKDVKPDIVFMDISMPKLDGISATKRIRDFENEQGLTATPIIALTAHSSKASGQDLFAEGLDYYLPKPLKRDALLEVVSNALPSVTPNSVNPETEKQADPARTVPAETGIPPRQTLSKLPDQSAAAR